MIFSEDGSKKLAEIVSAILLADPEASTAIAEVGGDEVYESFDGSFEHLGFGGWLERLKEVAAALVRLLEEYGPTDYERLISLAARRHRTTLSQIKYGFSYAKSERLILMGSRNPSLVLLPGRDEPLQ